MQAAQSPSCLQVFCSSVMLIPQRPRPPQHDSLRHGSLFIGFDFFPATESVTFCMMTPKRTTCSICTFEGGCLTWAPRRPGGGPVPRGQERRTAHMYSKAQRTHRQKRAREIDACKIWTVQHQLVCTVRLAVSGIRMCLLHRYAARG